MIAKVKKEVQDILFEKGNTRSVGVPKFHSDGRVKVLKENSYTLKKGRTYRIKGMWGIAQCTYLGKFGIHHVFESVQGGWKIAFSEIDMRYSLVQDWFPGMKRKYVSKEEKCCIKEL